jgi:4-carboxymuconolactone decarboxylase
MAKQQVPVKHYQELSKLFPEVLSAVENLGEAIRQAGPIPEKTVELVQLAGAAAIQMEGSVHSHTRRALRAGAAPEEIYQTLLLLISTIGFPKVSAAISWAQDILTREKKKK